MVVEEIKEIIANGNIINARSRIIAKLDTDRFKDNMDIASNLSAIISECPELFSEEKGSFSYKPRGQWNREYWTRKKTELSINFSTERLTHIVEVMIYLREQKNPKFIPREKLNERVSSGSSRSNKSSSGTTNCYISAGIGGAIGTAIGISMAKGVAVVLGGTILGVGAGIGIAKMLDSRD